MRFGWRLVVVFFVFVVFFVPSNAFWLMQFGGGFYENIKVSFVGLFFMLSALSIFVSIVFGGFCLISWLFEGDWRFWK